MKARDVMVSPVITLKPTTTVKEAAKLFLDRHISAAPVVDEKGKVIGIVSEGDLLHRVEAGTETQRPWWLRILASEEAVAQDYIRTHGRRVEDVMTRDVITVSPDTPLQEIANLLESKRIKRVPVLSNGQLVGIVSRANIIQAVASARKGLEIPVSDSAIRERLLAHLNAQPWAHTFLLNVTVNDGVVDLWGSARSEVEKKAIRVAAESIPGVRAVNDHLIIERMLIRT